jgi:hypothetical protein
VSKNANLILINQKYPKTNFKTENIFFGFLINFYELKTIFKYLIYIKKAIKYEINLETCNLIFKILKITENYFWNSKLIFLDFF